LKRGVISIGTNSTRALVAALNGTPQIFLTRSTGTRVGEGLKQRGHLEEEAMRRTLDAVAEHLRYVREFTSDYCTIATSALRRADNGQAFAQQVEAITGVALEIISGEEEARRSYIGAVHAINAPPQTRFGVVDIGGGSTEYAFGDKQGPEKIVSCEIGAVRLTEAVRRLAGTAGAVTPADIAHARELAMNATRPLETFTHADRLVFVGGSANTAVSLHRGSRESFSQAPLHRDELNRLIEILRHADLAARRSLPGMNPQRADILLGGLIILEVMFQRTRHEQALVSTSDLLLGTLLEKSFF
jgi:exopolyphosphatase/guanosine-5'-triphosphate,3'-diphosphate pyrophosphatase